MNGNIWKEVLKQHEMLGIENIIPVSHIRIRPDIGILLDEWQFCRCNYNQKRKMLNPMHYRLRK